MDTLVKLFEASVKKYPDNILMYEKQDGAYLGKTYRQIHDEVLQFGAGLMALGIRKGDRLALMAEGCTDWLVAELGIFYAGAIAVPLSIKLDAESDLDFRIRHSGSRMIIVSASQETKIDQLFNKTEGLEKIICLNQPVPDKPYKIAFGEVKNSGIRFLELEENRNKFESGWQNISTSDLANISYTSGTTAHPKGIMLTQGNYAENVRQANTLMTITPNYRTLTILPWDHSFAHTACLYCFMYNGASIAAQEIGKTAIETLKNIPKNINEIKPDIMMSVPAISKAFRKNIESSIRSKGKFTEMLFGLALKTANSYIGSGFNRGKGLRLLLKPAYQLFDAILFKKIRSAFGGNLKFFIGGGALLDVELQRFFAAIGIPVMQGYGLTEASPVISSNALGAHKIGSSGRLVKHLDIRICDGDGQILPQGQKGEIVIRGGNVMAGYWQNEEATRETIREGWLYTGDMGYLDRDGFLYVLGRFKSLLISGDGEKYSPEGIEEALVERSPFIDQVMLYNNQNAYTTGLIVPNMAAINRFLDQKGLKPGSREALEEAILLIQQEIHSFKSGGKNQGLFPDRWIPAAFAILPEAFSEQNGLINSTLKMVRGKIIDRFKSELDFLYTHHARMAANEKNMAAMARWYSNK